jgi:hypothetical protein
MPGIDTQQERRKLSTASTFQESIEVHKKKTPAYHIPHKPDILQFSKILSVLTPKLFKTSPYPKCFDDKKKGYMFNNIHDYVFKCENLFRIFHCNILICTNVKTSTGTEKCEFYAKNCDPRINNGLRHFDILQKPP